VTIAAVFVAVLTCTVADDPQGRVFELRRTGEGERAQWALAMSSRAAGSTPVLMRLPDAKPDLAPGRISLEYRTLNGGRHVTWRVTPDRATLDVYANFELEVNVDADLDPRVELMNTEGPIAALACSMAP
jgi:hypothetical protein